MKIKIKNNFSAPMVAVGSEHDAAISKSTKQAVFFEDSGALMWMDQSSYELIEDVRTGTPPASLTEMLGGSIKTLQVEFK